MKELKRSLASCTINDKKITHLSINWCEAKQSKQPLKGNHTPSDHHLPAVASSNQTDYSWQERPTRPTD